MNVDDASTKRTGQPRWAQRVEIAMYSSGLSSGLISGLPWRTYAVVFPASPIASRIVITTAV